MIGLTPYSFRRGIWPFKDSEEMGLKRLQTYLMQSNQQSADVPDLLRMVLAQALIVLYLHSEGF